MLVFQTKARSYAGFSLLSFLDFLLKIEQIFPGTDIALQASILKQNIFDYHQIDVLSCIQVEAGLFVRIPSLKFW